MSAPANASQGRKFVADIFRPAAATVIQTGVPLLTGNTNIAAKTADVNGQVDLSLPLRGLRFVFKLRVAVGTANYTNENPESLLNLVSKIRVIGNYKGNSKTIVDADLANLFGFANMFTTKLGSVIVNGTEFPRPGIPYEATNFFAGTTLGSPYDTIIMFDLLFGPYNASKRSQAGFLMRKEDWTNVNIHLESPAVVDNSQNPLGLSAATTVTTISAFGGAGGSMTCDIYGLPVRMGAAASTIAPGVLTRSATPLTQAILQAAMSNTLLATLDKQATTRVFVKVGTGAAASGNLVYTTLSDAVLTQLGLLVGSNVNVRQKIDVEAVRAEIENEFEVGGIQGMFLFDFIQHYGNQDQAYPADGLSDNQPFRLVGDGPGTANAQGHFIQEEIVVHPQGALFG